MSSLSIFQKLPKFWTGIVCVLASVEVYVLSKLLLRGEFFPEAITGSAYILAIVPTVIVCSAFGYLVYMGLKLPISQTRTFFGASLKQMHRLKTSLRILGVYFSCLAGMCATLLLCANNGPWRKLLDGISGPNGGLPDAMWFLIFVAVFGVTFLIADRFIQGLLGGSKKWIF